MAENASLKAQLDWESSRTPNQASSAGLASPAAPLYSTTPHTLVGNNSTPSIHSTDAVITSETVSSEDRASFLAAAGDIDVLFDGDKEGGRFLGRGGGAFYAFPETEEDSVRNLS